MTRYRTIPAGRQWNSSMEVQVRTKKWLFDRWMFVTFVDTFEQAEKEIRDHATRELNKERELKDRQAYHREYETTVTPSLGGFSEFIAVRQL